MPAGRTGRQRFSSAANVLVISVELPTLSFQRDDLSSANLISTAIFGDGAAAALLTGRPVPGAAILETQSHLFPRRLMNETPGREGREKLTSPGSARGTNPTGLILQRE